MARAEIKVKLVGLGGPKRLFILKLIARLFKITLMPQIVEDTPKVPKPAGPIGDVVCYKTTCPNHDGVRSCRLKQIHIGELGPCLESILK